VVAICILDTLENVRVNFPNKGGLLIRKNVFDGLNGEKATHQIMENMSQGRSDLPSEPRGIRTSEGRAEERVHP